MTLVKLFLQRTKMFHCEMNRIFYGSLSQYYILYFKELDQSYPQALAANLLQNRAYKHFHPH